MLSSVHAQTVHVIFGGDVMLGRIVKECILCHGASYRLLSIAQLMSSAGLTIVNLECAATSSTDWWSGARKAFYFGAPPEAIYSLNICAR